MKILKEDKRFNLIGVTGVQNPLKDTEDILDDNNAHLANDMIKT